MLDGNCRSRLQNQIASRKPLEGGHLHILKQEPRGGPGYKEETQRKTEAVVAALQACKTQNFRGAPANFYKCVKSGHFKKDYPGSKKST